MRGDEAKKKCPEITLVKVPCVRGKADLTKYREAGKQVAEVLKTFTNLLQRASVDEAYLDVTESVEKRIFHLTKPITSDNLKNTYVVGCSTEDYLHNLYENEDINIDDLRLTVGAVIAELLREEVYKITGYRCSAGIAHNKILAKQACGINKPNKQTILPHRAVEIYYKTLPVHKITGLGGKFGIQLAEKLGIQFMNELCQFSEKELIQKFDEKTAIWLYNIARGIDLEPVTTRLVSKSIGCCKKFPGKSALVTEEEVRHWLGELAQEIAERLEQDQMENNRKARQITVSFAQEVGRRDVSSSRTTALSSYDSRKIYEDTFEVIKKFCLKGDGTFHLKFLGLSAGNFEDMKNIREITSFFKMGESKTINEMDKNSNLERYFTSMENMKHELIEEKKELLSESIVEFEPEPSTSKPVIQDSSAVNDDNDSISSELFSSNETPESDLKQTSSFFVNYISSYKKDEDSKSPISRDFNTSKVLEENIESNSSDDKELIVQQNLDAANIHTTSDIAVEDTVTCDECGMAVGTSEIISHKDYHYALNIVKSEAEQYKQKTSEIKPNTGNVGKRGSVKRKQPEFHKTGTLEKFLKNQIINNETDEGEMCEDCKRRINFDELESHRDYHLAKRLHKEINSPKTTTSSNDYTKRVDTKSSIKNKNVKSKNNSSTMRTVTSFFKPL